MASVLVHFVTWRGRGGAVTIVFADVAGSTALGERLDPEALRRVMEGYYAEARVALERHGGTVEKFIGDAVCAVFGIPRVHEDDALRAVRAATKLVPAVAALGIGVRVGVNTGEVVAGDPADGQSFATGDAVNVAARLEQAARPGEILLGAATYGLVRDAVVAELVEPLEVRGKAEPLTAWRLLEVVAGAPALSRRLDSPLVGRTRERTALRSAFERTVRERWPVLVTVLAIEEAESLGLEPLRLLATMELAEQRMQTDPACSLDEALALAEQSIPVFESSSDDRGLTRAWELIGAVHFVCGRLDEARGAAERALSHAERIGDIRLQSNQQTIGASEDVATQVGWRTARAMMLARRRRHAEAETLAREAIERAAATEYCECLAEGFLALGEVLRLAERFSEATDAIREAIRLYEAKGFKMSADAARGRLAELQASSRSQ